MEVQLKSLKGEKTVSRISVMLMFFVGFIYSCNNPVNTVKSDTQTEMNNKGGIIFKVRVSVTELILSLSNNPSDTTFLKALRSVNENDISGEKFIKAFAESFENIGTFENKPDLASFFITRSNQTKITVDSNTEEVIKYLTREYDSAVESVYAVLTKRLSNAKLDYPEIMNDSPGTGILTIRIPAISDERRVTKLISSSGKLEFWKTYDSEDIDGLLIKSDEYYTSQGSEYYTSLSERLRPPAESYQLDGSIVGYTGISDKESVMTDLHLLSKNKKLPKDLVFAWSVKEVEEYPGYYALYALKSDRNGGAVLSGNFLTDAKSSMSQNQGSYELTLEMTDEAAQLWSRITRENISKAIAIVYDGSVYSAPIVNDQINGGKSTISGNFTVEEADELANILKSGSMPRVEILSVEVVKPKK